MEEQRRVGRTTAELTFWTLCPYCCYAHEYEKAYEECCLRCANCRRGFHAAAIRAPPPAEHKGAGGGGYYDCRFGLFRLSYDWSAREEGDEEEEEEVEDYLVERSSGDEGREGEARAEEDGEGMEEESCGGELEFEYEGDDILVSA